MGPRLDPLIHNIDRRPPQTEGTESRLRGFAAGRKVADNPSYPGGGSSASPLHPTGTIQSECYNQATFSSRSCDAEPEKVSRFLESSCSGIVFRISPCTRNSHVFPSDLGSFAIPASVELSSRQRILLRPFLLDLMLSTRLVQDRPSKFQRHSLRDYFIQFDADLQNLQPHDHVTDGTLITRL